MTTARTLQAISRKLQELVQEFNDGSRVLSPKERDCVEHIERAISWVILGDDRNKLMEMHKDIRNSALVFDDLRRRMTHIENSILKLKSDISQGCTRL